MSVNCNIRFDVDDQILSGTSFLALANRVWPGEYNPTAVTTALSMTGNITAWHDEILIGCVRILSDGYFFGTVTEILVDPDYQGQGVGKRIMELAWEVSPTSLFIGAQPGKESFYEKLGYQKSLNAYERRKQRG